jgi:site-specific recombinase XerD
MFKPKSHPYFSAELQQRMADDLALRGMSERTVEGYVRAVCKLAEFCKAAPDQISEPMLRKYLLSLAQRQLASGTLTVAYSGIKFFYKHTCRRHWKTLTQLKVARVHSLPVVITIPQVHSILDACTALRMLVYFWTVYSLGLRMNEALHLEVSDIDAARKLVHVHRGKGAKDRMIPLPTTTLLLLREYWKTHRHPRFLFPAEGRDHKQIAQAKTPMSETAVQGAMKKITKQLKFGKGVSIHTLRHSYATQTTLAEADILKVIEELFRRKLP